MSDVKRERIRIFATGACEGLPDVLRSLEAHEEIEIVGAREDVAGAAAALSGGHLAAVLHATRGSELPEDDLASIREHTAAPVIMLCSGECSALLEPALEAGVADVLPLPQLTENVVFAIRKAAHTGKRAQVADTGKRGVIATVFSPKGGTGKTVVATNLAAALAKHVGKNTLLLDLDLQFGDAAIMLGIEPDKTIYDFVVAPGELDSEKLAGYTTRHPCGLDVLPAPLRPEDAELVTEAKLARLLEVARRSYDVIVVDTSPFFHGPMLATLDRTDELLLVCAMEVPTIKNVRLSLQTLELLSFPPDRVRVVLNRSNSQVGIKPGEVERALESKIRYALPSDRAVPLGVNRGNPVVLADGNADFARAIRQLAADLTASEEKKPSARKSQARRQLFRARVKA
jgi:pilus assembly protein CpaE